MEIRPSHNSNNPTPTNTRTHLKPKTNHNPKLAIEILTAATIYLFALYILKALKNQDFQLLKQAFPKPLTKYINIIERLIVR